MRGNAGLLQAEAGLFVGGQRGVSIKERGHSILLGQPYRFSLVSSDPTATYKTFSTNYLLLSLGPQVGIAGYFDLVGRRRHLERLFGIQIDGDKFQPASFFQCLTLFSHTPGCGPWWSPWGFSEITP